MTISSIPLAEPRRTEILGAAWGFGAKDPRTAHGPVSLQQQGLTAWLEDRGIPVHWPVSFSTPAVADGPPVIDTIAGLCARLAEGTRAAVRAGHRVAVLGGDHSCAIGTWAGVHNGLDGGPLGLIWIDAHMDAHTPATSPSGAVHGMPLACLLGLGDEKLVALAEPAPALLPNHCCLIGVRSYEPAEVARLDQLGVRVFAMGEVKHRGLGPVMNEALERVGTGTAGAGLSLDLDARGPRDAPGGGSPERDGRRAPDLIGALRAVHGLENFIGIEIAEYNPYRDRETRTAMLIRELLASVLPGGEQ